MKNFFGSTILSEDIAVIYTSFIPMKSEGNQLSIFVNNVVLQEFIQIGHLISKIWNCKLCSTVDRELKIRPFHRLGLQNCCEKVTVGIAAGLTSFSDHSKEPLLPNSFRPYWFSFV